MTVMGQNGGSRKGEGGVSMKVTTLGIDLAKRSFQLHGVDMRGKVALQKRVTRAKLREAIATKEVFPCEQQQLWRR